MSEFRLRDKLRGEIAAIDAPALLPHHRRGALMILAAEVDLLDTAHAVATDDAKTIAALIDGGMLYKPSLAQLADWCVDAGLRLQFVIVQPYVLAQPLPGAN